ncbi:MAG: IS4 family transposase [Chloroflexota bacterium]|nr:IS4 family transposase [Chloroflexota bacterium]
MTSIADLVPALQTLLTTTADQAGRDSGLIQRVRVFTGATFVQMLVFGWLGTPDATLEHLAQTAATLGVRITGQGIADRFSPQSADCLAHVLAAAIQQTITATPTDLAVLNRFAGVVVIDGSVIGLPAALAVQFPGGANQMSSHAALKIGVGVDLLTGRLDGPHLMAARPHDRLLPIQDAPLAPGVLRLADLGFFDLSVLATLSAQHGYWLTRVQVGTVVLDPTGQRHDLLTLLRQRCKRTLDLPILLGVRERLPCRLLAERVPKAVANERRQRLRDAARQRGQTVSARKLTLADWTIRVTNVPAERLSVAEAMVVGRVRWQIELLFKLWKRDGKIDEWRSTKPWRILTEVYAKLLAMVIQHWIVVVTSWQYPQRSMVKGAQTVRAHACYLACVFADADQLATAFASIERCLVAGGRINKRRKRPNTCQLLQAVAA